MEVRAQCRWEAFLWRAHCEQVGRGSISSATWALDTLPIWLSNCLMSQAQGREGKKKQWRTVPLWRRRSFPVCISMFKVQFKFVYVHVFYNAYENGWRRCVPFFWWLWMHHPPVWLPVCYRLQSTSLVITIQYHNRGTEGVHPVLFWIPFKVFVSTSRTGQICLVTWLEEAYVREAGILV